MPVGWRSVSLNGSPDSNIFNSLFRAFLSKCNSPLSNRCLGSSPSRRLSYLPGWKWIFAPPSRRSRKRKRRRRRRRRNNASEGSIAKKERAKRQRGREASERTRTNSSLRRLFTGGIRIRGQAYPRLGCFSTRTVPALSSLLRLLLLLLLLLLPLLSLLANRCVSARCTFQRVYVHTRGSSAYVPLPSSVRDGAAPRSRCKGDPRRF